MEGQKICQLWIQMGILLFYLLLRFTKTEHDSKVCFSPGLCRYMYFPEVLVENNTSTRVYTHISVFFFNCVTNKVLCCEILTTTYQAPSLLVTAYHLWTAKSSLLRVVPGSLPNFLSLFRWHCEIKAIFTLTDDEIFSNKYIAIGIVMFGKLLFANAILSLNNCTDHLLIWGMEEKLR